MKYRYRIARSKLKCTLECDAISNITRTQIQSLEKRRALRRRTGGRLRRFGSSRMDDEEESMSRTQSLRRLESTTKQFSDLPIDVEEEENSSTDKMNEKRRFACKQLDELRLFEWCYRKLHRRIRQQQGFYDRTSRTDLVMRRRRGGGFEDLLQEDIRAKQILLGTLVELSTVALEQVMSTCGV